MSAKINDGGLAFPMAGSTREWDDVKKQWKPQEGMTLRDWFAGKALQGMMSNSILLKSNGEFNESNFKACYECADAMIAAREAKS